MRKIVLSVIATLLCAMGYAQDLPKIVPPSPESASLGKFTGVPVALNNGLVNVSVPIHTVQVKGLSIPITLNYHSRGVKVDEIASRTGIGWALSYGGMISRTVLGKPDDAGPWAYLNQNYGSDIQSNITTKENIFNKYCNSEGKLDLESDLFNLNMGSVSGKFYFDQSDKINPVLKEFDDIKVTAKWEGGIIVAFVGMDASGNTFYFGQSKNGEREYYSEKLNYKSAIYRSGEGGSLEYINDNDTDVYETHNTWHLVEIETPFNEKIEFFYEQETVEYVIKNYDSYTPQFPYSPSAWSEGWRPVNEAKKECLFSFITERQYQLSEIRYGNADSNLLNKVLFNKAVSPSRLDLKGGSELENIEIKDKNNRLIKSFDLEYKYSHNTKTSGYLPILVEGDKESHYRLMLSSIQQKNALNESLPPYLFEYDSQVLPNRFSNSKDVWGYFNGKENYHFLTLNPYNTLAQPNREVDLIKSEAGILKKVTYPTGGYSTFTYEHNTAVPSYNMEDFITYNFNPIRRVDTILSHKEHLTHFDGKYYTKEFTIKNIIGETVSTSISFDDESNCLEDAWKEGCKFRVSISGNGISPFQIFKGNHQIYLPDGTYTLKVEPLDFEHTPLDHTAKDGFVVLINWRESLQNEKDFIYGPGKRIKKIEFYDDNDELISKQEYEYKKDDGTTSGVLIGLPDFYPKAILAQPNFQFHTGVMAGSKTNIYQANQVAYSNVTEYFHGDGINAGKKEYEYTTFLDGGEFYRYPYFTPNDNEWLRGKILKTRFFNYNNTTGLYSLKKEVVNNYLYANDIVSGESVLIGGKNNENDDFFDKTKASKNFIKFVPIYTVSVFKSVDLSESSHLIEVCDMNNYLVYQRKSGTQDLYSTTETNYFASGNTVSTTNYFYDYDNHYQLAGSESVNVKGELYKTTNEYEKLLIPFRIVPTDTKIYKDGIELSHQRTVYDSAHNPSNLYLPSKIQTSKGSNVLEDRVVYHAYDNKGNPTEVSKADGTHIIYIWGYNQTQPIAKIENAVLSNIPLETITDLQTKSNADINAATETILRTALNNLRSIAALANAHITTFTYDPLVGVTSVTDPRGETMYYEYDSFNRLEFVKDAQGNILKENKYNYKN